MKTSFKQARTRQLWTIIAVSAGVFVVAAVGCGQVIGVDGWTPGASGQGGQGGDTASSSNALSAVAATGSAGSSTGGMGGAGNVVSSAGPGGSAQTGPSSSASGSGGSVASTGVSSSAVGVSSSAVGVSSSAVGSTGVSASSSVASSGTGGPTTCMDTSDCGVGLTCCDHFCVNTGNDILNCGACGNICPLGAQFCDGSTCQPPPCEGNPTPVCLGTEFCCGLNCCKLGQLCCEIPKPGPSGGVECADPVNGTCPIGCPGCG